MIITGFTKVGSSCPDVFKGVSRLTVECHTVLQVKGVSCIRIPTQTHTHKLTAKTLSFVKLHTLHVAACHPMSVSLNSLQPK